MDIKVLISAPGDQHDAAEAAIRAIGQLNEILELHGHKIATRHWKTNLSTGRALRAQEVINDQTADCNAVIAIFGARIGTSTGEYLSGTAEEIERFLAIDNDGGVKYDVHVFFRASTEVNLMNIDTEQLKLLQQFRKSLESRGVYYYDFTSIGDLEQAVSRSINNLIARRKPAAPGAASLKSPVPSVPAPVIPDVEEVGFDDALAEGSQGFVEASGTMEKISAVMTRTTEAVDGINKRALAGPVTQVTRARFLKDTCDSLDKLRGDLAPLVAELQEQMDQAYAAIGQAFTIAAEDSIGSSQSAEWHELRRLALKTTESVIGFRDSAREGRNTINALPRMTKDLNKAKRGAVSVFDNLVAHLTSSAEKSQSIVNTINRIIGDEKMI